MDAEQYPKRRKLTDFFQKLSKSDLTPVPGCLRQFQPTDVLRRAARPKRSVGRPRSVSRAEPRTPEPSPDAENQQNSTEEKSKARGVYRAYSLRQKMEIVHFARQSSETAASRKYGMSRSTIYGWRDIDKEPIEKKIPKNTKGKHTKKGAGRPISYPQELEDDVVAWVLRQRDLQMPVRRQDIQFKATALITPDHPLFKASSGWIDKFMTRHSLSLR